MLYSYFVQEPKHLLLVAFHNILYIHIRTDLTTLLLGLANVKNKCIIMI